MTIILKNKRFNKFSKAVFKPKTLEAVMHLYTTVLLEANRSKREKKKTKQNKQTNKKKQSDKRDQCATSPSHIIL